MFVGGFVGGVFVASVGRMVSPQEKNGHEEEGGQEEGGSRGSGRNVLYYGMRLASRRRKMSYSLAPALEVIRVPSST